MVIWIDETTFKTRLNIRTYYIIQCPDTTMKSQYLKPIFKSGRLIVSIWEVITYRKTGSVHFLAENSQIILEIYINQVYQLLVVFFYKEYLGEIGKIMYMNDSTIYYTSKLTKKFHIEVRLLYMIWLMQSLDFNSIKNL